VPAGVPETGGSLPAPLPPPQPAIQRLDAKRARAIQGTIHVKFPRIIVARFGSLRSAASIPNTNKSPHAPVIHVRCFGTFGARLLEGVAMEFAAVATLRVN
jgi:hypothetical protein